jgi:hypothetical protein
MDIPAMFRRAVAEFDARVRQIGAHQWQAATPDEGWTVRAVPPYPRPSRGSSPGAACLVQEPGR